MVVVLTNLSKPNSDPEKIEKLLKKQDTGNMCYVMTSLNVHNPLTDPIKGLW